MSKSLLYQAIKFGLLESKSWFDAIIRYVPGYTGVLLRRAVYRACLGQVGHGLYTSMGVVINPCKNVYLGDFVSIHYGSGIYAQDGICRIGDRTIVGINAFIGAGQGEIIIGNDAAINGYLRASSHKYQDPLRPVAEQGHERGKIVIEDNAWLANSVVILPGTHIGKGAVVIAGSVVSGKVKPYSIVGGNPARVIGMRGRPTVAELEARRLNKLKSIVK